VPTDELGEEALFRGYLFERLGKLLGSSVWATIASVLISPSRDCGFAPVGKSSARGTSGSSG